MPVEDERKIRWVGSSYEDLLLFPDDPRRTAGFQLGKVQAGLEPDDWKPFDDVGAGTKQATSKHDKDIAEARYRAVIRDRRASP